MGIIIGVSTLITNVVRYSRFTTKLSDRVHKTAICPKCSTPVTELPWVYIAISNAKRNLLNNFPHVGINYLQNYPDEFTYRLNRRYFGERLFEHLLIACISFCWVI